MKKLLFSLLSLLMVSGLAWADGVKVSGDVTTKDYYGMLRNGTATLSSGSTEVATVSLGMDGNRNCYTYEFTEVQSGTYTLSITANGYNNTSHQYDDTYKKEVTVEVASDNVEQNVELELYVDEEAGKTVKMWIDPRFISNADPRLFGVTGTCKKKGSEGEGQTATGAASASEGDNRLEFTCDTSGLYVVTLHKEGYKDTTFETKSWEVNGGQIMGRTVLVLMEDAPVVENDLVTLTGTVSLGTHTDISLSEKLQLFYRNGEATNTLYSDIQNGKYAFTNVPKNASYDSLSVVTVVYGSYGATTYRSSAMLQVKTPANGVLDLSSATPDNDTITYNIELERIGFSVKGSVKNAANGSGLAGVTVKLGDVTVTTFNDGERWGSDRGDFIFDVVTATQLSFEFSKAGFTTLTKDTTISMAAVGADGVVTLAPIAMTPQAQEYTLAGKAGIKPNTALKDVVVELWSAQLVENQGYVKGNKLGADTTDAEGAWSLKYTGFADDYVYLIAKHADMETEEMGRPISYLISQTSIDIYGSPILYGMVNCRATQDAEAATPTVNLTWEWPQALRNGYVDENGEGTYEITMVSIFRTVHRADQEDYTVKVCDTTTVPNTLPLTSFVDAGVQYPLSVDSTYTYYFTLQYSGKPDYKTIEVKDSANLTVKIAAKPVDPVKDSFELTLNCDATMGSVEGAGKYEEGTPVDIKATANEGYVFVAWMSGNDTVAKTAEHKVILMSDSTLTAVFAKKSVDPSANEDREQASWNVYVEGQTIVLQSNAACQYDVYNLTGALVKRAKTNANEYRIAVNNSGLYIIRRISATGTSVKKVMVR